MSLPLDAMAEDKSITILFTGDRHGHIESWLGWEGPLAGKNIGGMDWQASAVEAVRNEVGPHNVLLLDSGDAIGDTFIASKTKGGAIIEMMNLAGYDAMTIGNHEPDFGMIELRARMAEARFPVLAANIRDEQGRLFAKPFVIREVNGVKIGILGLAYANTPLTTARKNIEGFSFENPIEAAQRTLPEMRAAGAQIIIALAHGGLGAERKWAEDISGIHVIIGGHSHNRMEKPLVVEGVILAQAGAHGSDLGRLDLRVRDGRIRDYRLSLVVLDHDKIPSHGPTAEKLNTIKAPFREEAGLVIGRALKPLVRAQTMAGGAPRKRNQESPADSLFADILRERTGSDIALLPGVGYGVAIPRGNITVEQLRNLLPHPAKVVTLVLTGLQVRDILEQAVTNACTANPEEKVGGMIQVSGLNFTYDEGGTSGGRLCSVETDGSALDPDRDYKVATNTMLAAGGHNYATFLQGKQRQEHEEEFRVVINYMLEKGAIEPPSGGRIRSVNE